MGKYPMGSEWRIWDLHFHTPASYDYKNKAVTNEEIIDSLASNNVSVVAITDHHIIDVARIKQLQSLGVNKNITVLPGIEFCSELGGSESIHFIAIFPEYADIETIWTKLQGQCNLTAADIQEKGEERICCEFVKTCNHIIDLGGIITIHAGKKSNTIESIKNNLLVKQELKQNLLSTFRPILDIGKPEDEIGYKEHVFPEIKFSLPIILCSDNHNINEYSTKNKTWIKSDPTFDGLKQIIYEPEGRVRIQVDNPTFDIEKSPFTQIKIPQQTQVFSDDNDVFFAPTELPLNSSLVSIIGGRGTGKSVLINYLSAAFCKNPQSDKYNLKTDIVISRRASINETAKEFKVSDNPNVPFMYIAQSQIKDLVQDKTKFSKNILETIGVSNDYSLPSDYVKKSEDAINEYFRIIKIINTNGTSAEEKEEQIRKEIKKYSEFIANITSEQNKTRLEGYKNKIGKLNTIQDYKNQLQQFNLSISKFEQDSNKQIADWNQRFNSWKIDIPVIDVQEQIKYIQEIFLPKFDAAAAKIQKDIDDTKNEFKDYKGDLSTLLSNVSGYQNQISELGKQLEIISQEKTKYHKVTTELFKNLGEEIRSSVEAYSSLIEKQWESFKGKEGDKKKELLDIILKEDLAVKVSINFNTTRMYNLLLEKLDGRSYNEDKLKKLLRIETIDDFYDFICQRTANNVFNKEIRDDLRGRVLELFFKRYTAFISHNVDVTLNGKPINKLSYGQQGTIYLRLQIAANLYSETIIYDQPEDDLDNSFITSELIAIFKKIKQYRQIIIVSHNANLVVNADSEQVIIAKNDDGILSYMSGALEDPDINKAVCQILEGGKNAFEKREQKYSISQ
jgi:energy-coupling factor transporter ATP-binding protein EcfA2